MIEQPYIQRVELDPLKYDCLKKLAAKRRSDTDFWVYTLVEEKECTYVVEFAKPLPAFELFFALGRLFPDYEL